MTKVVERETNHPSHHGTKFRSENFEFVSLNRLSLC